MTSSLIASAMLRDPLYHIECLTAPSYTKYLISSMRKKHLRITLVMAASVVSGSCFPAVAQNTPDQQPTLTAPGHAPAPSTRPSLAPSSPTRRGVRADDLNREELNRLAAEPHPASGPDIGMHYPQPGGLPPASSFPSPNPTPTAAPYGYGAPTPGGGVAVGGGFVTPGGVGAGPGAPGAPAAGAGVSVGPGGYSVGGSGTVPIPQG